MRRSQKVEKNAKNPRQKVQTSTTLYCYRPSTLGPGKNRPFGQKKVEKRPLIPSKPYKCLGKRCLGRIIFSDEHWYTSLESANRTLRTYEAASTCPVSRERENRCNGPCVTAFTPIVGFNDKSKLTALARRQGSALQAWEYARRCLRPVVQLAAECFMQDSTRIHVTKITLPFLGRNGVKLLHRWLAASPDLNPIETIWGELNHHLQAMLESGQAETAEELTRYVRSLVRRVRKCVQRRGAP